jgi:LexA-binding, inner membrane-associated putative hydrolase
MPSPLVHSFTGYLIYRVLQLKIPEECHKKTIFAPRLLVITVGLSILPDLDAIPGILTGDIGRFHNQWMNSFVASTIVALGIGVAVWSRRGSGFVRWFSITLLCYTTHILMDFFTWGRGVMLLWPFSSYRYKPPANLFYGLHWSQGLISSAHLWTVLTELGFIAVVSSIAHYLFKARFRPAAQD